jgi:hypothetical protein
MEGAGRSGLTNQEMNRSEMQGAGQRHRQLRGNRAFFKIDD